MKERVLELVNKGKALVERNSENPTFFFRIAIGLGVMAAIFILAIDQQPGTCKATIPPTCTHPWPNPGPLSMLVALLALGFAGFAVWHALELRKRERDLAQHYRD